MIRVFSGVGFPSSSQTVARYEWGHHDANGYYDALGLTPDCTFAEIKSAYRELARKYHPDGAEPDAEKFREIREIYEVLSNPVTRGEYNRIDPSTGEFYLGNLEKEMLHDLAAQHGKSTEDFAQAKKESEKFFDYFAHEEDHQRAQAWYEHVLSVAYFYHYHGTIRIGLDSDWEKILSNNHNMDYIVFWFDPNLTPNWASAFMVVSDIADFVWNQPRNQLTRL